MIIDCWICHKPFKEGEEIVFTGYAYWHELGSKVAYSISKPHEVAKDTIHHSDCYPGD